MQTLFSHDCTYDVVVELCDKCEACHHKPSASSETLEQMILSDKTLVVNRGGITRQFKVITEEVYSHFGHRVHVRALEEVDSLPDACVISMCERRIIGRHCTKAWSAKSMEDLDVACFTSSGKLVQTYRGKKPLQWLKKINICS